MNKANMRSVVSLITIGGFFAAYFIDPSEIFAGAIVASFTQAVSYFLGSSQGASENRETLNKLHDKKENL